MSELSLECEDCGGSPVEANGKCATCNHLARKAERLAQKPIKTYRIPKVSQKRKEETPIYSKRRVIFLQKHPHCQIKLVGCKIKATQVHHAAKRGKNYLNEETWMSACDYCHDQTETVLSAKDRREKGLLRS